MKKINVSVFVIGMCLSATVFAQWNISPSINTSISASLNDQQDARIVTDAKGGAIITWVDFRNSLTLADIFVQRVNASGYPLWTLNGTAICTDLADQTAVGIVDADNGGAILTWQDWRNGDRDIYAQKIDSSGNVLWTSNGVAVCVKVNHQSSPKIISDAAGGAIIVWEDSSLTGNWDIYAQRISNTGTPLWTTNGVIICNTVYPQINPKIETDGNGGGIITWQDKRNGGNYDIYAQRINSLGSIQWTVNGLIVSNAVGNQTNPKIEPDGAGGAIIGWQDKRNGTDYDIYVQRINTSGITQWTSNGVAVCTATGTQSAVDMTTDGINGVIISWKDVRSVTSGIYASIVNPSGIVQWASNGVALGNGVNPNVVGNGSGGAIICWQDSTSGTWNVYAQNLNANGVKQWGATGVDIATAAGNQTSPKNVATGNGGSIFAFQDFRTGGDFDIYAHRLNANGTIIGVPDYFSNENKRIDCYPNPFQFQTTLSINSPKDIEKWQLTVYDVTGKIILLQTINNSKSATIYKNNLPSGLYFYQITNQTEVLGNGKFSIID